MRRAWMVVVALGGLGLLGCSDDLEPTPSDGTTGIANPASTFCVDQGGTVEIVTEAGGEVGYCNLPDGTRIEEWEFFRQMTGNTQP